MGVREDSVLKELRDDGDDGDDGDCELMDCEEPERDQCEESERELMLREPG